MRTAVNAGAALCAALVGLPPWALAHAAPSADRAEVLKQLSACRAVADSAQRLACYDAAAAALDTAEAKGDVVVVDRAQARAARRQAFGFNLPTLAIFDKAATREELDAVTATVSSAYQGEQGRWIMELDDGAEWRQTDDAVLSREPHQGSHVRIKRAALGSYMMEIDGQPSIRVRRDR